jgi:hypothetical protein
MLRGSNVVDFWTNFHDIEPAGIFPRGGETSMQPQICLDLVVNKIRLSELGRRRCGDSRRNPVAPNDLRTPIACPGFLG